MVRIDRHLVLSNGVHKIDIGKFLLRKRSGVYIICEINIFAPPLKNHIFSPNLQNKNRYILQVSEARMHIL